MHDASLEVRHARCFLFLICLLTVFSIGRRRLRPASDIRRRDVSKSGERGRGERESSWRADGRGFGVRRGRSGNDFFVWLCVRRAGCARFVRDARRRPPSLHQPSSTRRLDASKAGARAALLFHFNPPSRCSFARRP
ncbi:hypothetical protein SCHPADRAFT_263221 [Schizopora paradoxa]|uniref:Uncharacterized protein n=1 Tax=Schizopora paradoxa TaxID=27342 RepID=A0A0H2S161_9AGAM|nr:hypothetical protein SCHPADRAFT_263221 [Schizopora paradoxa]